MATLKERYVKWKSRKWHQKAGDLFFWLLLVLLIIPGPRKFIATNLNRGLMHLRIPSVVNENKAYNLSDAEYNWDLRDEAGNVIEPESLKGQVIFLNFWGTYCPPCIAEMPEIQKLYEDYGDKVTFVLVSGEDPSKVANFMQSRQYTVPSFTGGRAMPEVFSVTSIPTTFIISKEGKLIMRKRGAASWNSRATRRLLNDLLIR